MDSRPVRDLIHLITKIQFQSLIIATMLQYVSKDLAGIFRGFHIIAS